MKSYFSYLLYEFFYYFSFRSTILQSALKRPAISFRSLLYSMHRIFRTTALAPFPPGLPPNADRPAGGKTHPPAWSFA
jgi:hypothetical protein